MRRMAGRARRAALAAAAALALAAALAGCAPGGAAPASGAPGMQPALGSAAGDAGGAPSGGASSVMSGAAAGGQPPAPGNLPGNDPLNAENLTACRAVLQGQAEFLLAGEPGAPAQPMTVEDIPRIFSPASEYARLEQFALLDLDGDGAQELVLQSIDVAGDMGGYLVLHMQEDGIYGFVSDWRSFWGLKTDGSFEYSSPTGREWGVCTVHFADGAMLRDTPLYSGTADETFETTAYTVAGQAADEQAYAAAQAAQAAKPDAVWYPFDEEGIRQALGA